jgi:hypothetical protein
MRRWQPVRGIGHVHVGHRLHIMASVAVVWHALAGVLRRARNAECTEDGKDNNSAPSTCSQNASLPTKTVKQCSDKNPFAMGSSWTDGQLEWRLDAKGRETVRHYRQNHFTGNVVYRDCGAYRRGQTRFKSDLPGWCWRDRRPQNRRFMPGYTARMIGGRMSWSLLAVAVTSRRCLTGTWCKSQLCSEGTRHAGQHQNDSDDSCTRFHIFSIQMPTT